MRAHRLARHPRLLVVAMAFAVAPLVLACNGDGDPKRTAWTCNREAIPSGATIRCSNAALVAEGSSTLATSYVCAPNASAEDCPPAQPPLSTESSVVEGGAECGYTDDLPYCAGEASSAPGGGSCDEPRCELPPGKAKKREPGATDGEAASSSSSSGGTGGRGWTCRKSKEGTTCESVPDCPAGTHAAPCGACVSDDEGDGDCVPPSEGGCWITGGGFVESASRDNFGGNAKPMKGGTVEGHWNHVAHANGAHTLGQPEYLHCRSVGEPGPGNPGGKKGLTANQAYFGGHARHRANGAWEEGYWFDVVVKDHGEPGSRPKPEKNGGVVDTYHFTLRRIVDPENLASGTVVYEASGDLAGGNIQLHASNGGHPPTQSPLPSWVSLEP